MSVAADTHGYDNCHGAYGGNMRWITTTDHREISTLHLAFSLTMFFVGCANLVCEFPFSQPRPPLWS